MASIQEDYIAREAKVCAPNYSSLPVVLSRGEGVWLYDIDGRKYLDMMSAYSAVSHGHCHPELVKIATEQVNRLTLCSRAYHAPSLAPFLEKICAMTGMDLV